MMQVAVIGAGAMGSGIAQVAAMAGNEVFLFDNFPEQISKARDSINESLNKLAAKGKITDSESNAIFGRIFFLEQFESIRNCKLVIEAIIEREDEKKKLFQRIEPLVVPDALIATNTSSLSVTALGGSLQHPHRFIGIHFFNPPVLMKLVEIIPALQTSQHYIDQTVELIKSWDKQPVIAKDTPGFIVNRIARPYYGEALRIVEEQLASPELVDSAMKEIGGFRMGPFELMDFIGHDINTAVTRSVWTSFYYDARYRPSFLQENLVKAKWLGKKTGKGFYIYANGQMEPSPLGITDTSKFLSNQQIFERIITMLINEAADALYIGLASKDHIEMAMTMGVNYPRGLLKWADEIGIARCVQIMDALYDFYKEERYRCSPGLKQMATAEQTYY